MIKRDGIGDISINGGPVKWVDPIKTYRGESVYPGHTR